MRNGMGALAALAGLVCACGAEGAGNKVPPAQAQAPADPDAAPGPSGARGAPEGGQAADSSSDQGPTPTAPPASSMIGAACVPPQEDNASFGGFDVQEVNVGTNAAACGGSACLANHFQGRVTCPYGQSAAGQAPQGASACTVPGTSEPVTQPVAPQCTSRTAANTVYCSCRCANANGQTNDGASYCACPGTMICTQLVGAFGSLPDGGLDTLSGAYCIKAGTAYDPSTSSCSALCDPATASCPSLQL